MKYQRSTKSGCKDLEIKKIIVCGKNSLPLVWKLENREKSTNYFSFDNLQRNIVAVRATSKKGWREASLKQSVIKIQDPIRSKSLGERKYNIVNVDMLQTNTV